MDIVEFLECDVEGFLQLQERGEGVGGIWSGSWGIDSADKVFGK